MITSTPLTAEHKIAEDTTKTQQRHNKDTTKTQQRHKQIWEPHAMQDCYWYVGKELPVQSMMGGVVTLVLSKF